MVLAEHPVNQNQPHEVRLADFVLVVLVLAATFVTAAWRPASELADAWFNGLGYSHGPLVVAMSAYVLFGRIKAIRQVSADWHAIPLIAICSLLMSIGMMLHVRVVALFFLPILFLSFVLFVVGRRNAIKVAGPIFFLYFAIPVWFPLIGILQYATVEAVSWMVGIAGIPANISGNFVHLPYGTFEIADGCAGLRYVVVGLALGAFIAMTSPEKIPAKIRVLALAFVLAVVGNCIRVFIIVKVGHDSNMTHRLISDHNSLGWFVFAVAMIPLIVVARRGGVHEKPVAEIDTQPKLARSRYDRLVLVLLAFLAAMVPVSYAANVTAKAERSFFEFKADWPRQTDRWVVSDIGGGWEPYFANSDFLEVRRFSAGASVATAYVAGYYHQSQGKEPDYYANQLFPDQAVILKTEKIDSKHGNLVRQALSDPINGESIVYYRYAVGNRFALSKVNFKLQTLRELVMGNYAAGVIGLWVNCQEACDDTRSLQLELVNSLQWKFE